jgi:glycosyltransferase involved in cell wall biosynthesis
MDNQKRLRIGIVFNFSKNWLGGVYYILNIIKSLNFLDDKDKPVIIIFYNPELKEFTKEINYHHAELVPFHFTGLLKGYAMSWLKGKNLFVEELIQSHQLDTLFPVRDYPVPPSNHTKVISWNADFQHKFYPGFFSKRTLLGREVRFKLLVRNAPHVVLSSNNAATHMRSFYKLPGKIKIHILQFVSIIDDFNLLNAREVKAKYNIADKYFLISNQFHRHKNHITAFKSIKLLHEKGININLIITGKIENRGNDSYVDEVLSYIELNKLDDAIKLLGVIPRKDQLSLMKHARAVIQPSLFEGWSTVIEDAKSLQVPVIASDLPVNREQLRESGYFFNANKAEELAEIIQSFQIRTDQLYDSYESRVRNFAYNFIRVMDPDMNGKYQRS